MLLTPAEAAEYLGQSELWVLNSLRDFTLPGRKVRGRWYLSRPELDAWLVRGTTHATQPARAVRPKRSRRAA